MAVTASAPLNNSKSRDKRQNETRDWNKTRTNQDLIQFQDDNWTL